jgi:hypothetical protein
MLGEENNPTFWVLGSCQFDGRFCLFQQKIMQGLGNSELVQLSTDMHSFLDCNEGNQSGAASNLTCARRV